MITNHLLCQLEHLGPLFTNCMTAEGHILSKLAYTSLLIWIQALYDLNILPGLFVCLLKFYSRLTLTHLED